MTSTLILLRHGESTWNALNQFTGWVDVPLSEKGTAEAIRGGVLLRETGLLPDVVHTSVLRRAIETAHLVLDVADRGPGIAPDEVARLKQPFTRASASRTNANGVAGAGLGLAIVDRIARLHGGAFDLLPRDGGGTIARVAIPLGS